MPGLTARPGRRRWGRRDRTVRHKTVTTPPDGQPGVHHHGMTKTLTTISATLLLATLAACSSGTTVTDTPKAAPTSKSTPKTTASQTPAPPKVAKTGDTIALTGTEDGSKLDVTIVKVADNAKSSVEGFEPETGNRWIGVQLRLLNTGTIAYNDSPGNGVKIADSEGQQFTSTFADITAGPSMASSVTLKPGAKALGWIVFEIPKASKVATVQFAMDSGFADQTGEWALS